MCVLCKINRINQLFVTGHQVTVRYINGKLSVLKIVLTLYVLRTFVTKMNSRKSFFDTIRLLYIIGKFFGLSCYDISKERWKYKTSFRMSHFLHLVAYVGLLLTLLTLNQQLQLNNDENNTRIFNQTQKVLIVMSLVFLSAGSLLVLLMRRNFWNIVNRLSVIDNQVRAHECYL